MRQVSIKKFDGSDDIINAYEVSDYHLYELPDRWLNCRYTKNPLQYYRLIATFDIETTTIIPGGDAKPYGYMYHWQMDIGGIVVYGRRWEEWVNLMQKISSWLELDPEHRMIVYVHNLAYEFQFIYNLLDEYFDGFEVFAAQKRKPMKVSTGNGFEFRCSYKLTNMNLEKACKNELGVKHPKAAGDLDYKICRTAETFLNDTEFGYCIADVVCLYDLILCRLKNEHDTNETIPLTSTGYVRRDCRKATKKQPRYREKVFKKNIMNESVYTMLCEAGRGGNTHANRYMSGRIWDCGIDSYDVASSYPAQLMLKEFPMTSFSNYGDVDDMEEFEHLLNTKACLFRIAFENIEVRPEVTMPYIASSKALQLSRGRFDNGRVLSADAISLTLTDVDFKIIRKQYTWDEFAISDMHIANYGTLPEAIRQQVMEYFRLKSQLKYDIEVELDSVKKANYKYLYAKSKNRLNSIFGMMYTNPVHPELVFDSGEWRTEIPDIAEALDKYFKGRNSFLIYSWGVWCTARARAHLEDLLDATGAGTIYCDTDSSKCMITDVERQKIEALNIQIRQDCENKGAYCDVNGERFYLGVYECETEKEQYSQFKTLGAKKYAYTDSEGLHVTISGVNKQKAPAELGSIENFKMGFVFHEAGGNTLYYNDDELHYITIDGCTMLTGSNIGMTDSTYEIGLAGDYMALLGLDMEDLE